ncbi:unnamed protein product [Sphenostylis stenocarpa]|uniref:Uncharacterized protein n=1 Tax=Sphenostylis stenocarpa TaxID=92480 RepID=A0AA86S2M6_9FABA|nr:unnamed protein product [Sphenostylis stenocarpa]
MAGQNQTFAEESVDRGVWDAILNGPFVPKTTENGVDVLKPISRWTREESRKAQFDCTGNVRNAKGDPRRNRRRQKSTYKFFNPRIRDVRMQPGETIFDVRNVSLIS